MRQEQTRKIFLSPPHMTARDRELLLDAFDSNWIAPVGPHVEAFEKEFAEATGMPHAVALSSGTAALHISMCLLGVEPGDEVITSSFTFAAAANAITYRGAKPVFVDSETDSWNMDPELLAEELQTAANGGRLPKAVIAVDIYGQCANYPRIVDICQRYDVPIIEDAAEALGARCHGKPAGTFGQFGCFSFNGNKIITTSGGGMLVTHDRDAAQEARFLAAQARDEASHYQHTQIGYNYRMSNLLAAVGRGQMEVLERRVEQRRANFQYYRDALGTLPGITFMPEPDYSHSTRWLSCVEIDPLEFGASRDEILGEFGQQGIEARPLWKPMHMQPVFSDCRMRGGKVAEALFARGICLPSGSNLALEDKERVVAAIKDSFRGQTDTDNRNR